MLLTMQAMRPLDKVTRLNGGFAGIEDQIHQRGAVPAATSMTEPEVRLGIVVHNHEVNGDIDAKHGPALQFVSGNFDI